MPEWSFNAARPQHFGRMADWFGVWSIEETAGRALFEQIQRIDLKLHVQDALSAAPVSENTGLPLYTIDQGVALIALDGPIMKHASSFGGASTVETRRALRAAVNDAQVTAILLQIDSPGGTVAGTGDLADEIFAARQKKPVYAYIEDLGASAAYQIASQADKVFVNPSGAVGSIGVYSVVRDLSGMAEEMRIKVHVIKAGEFKGAGVPGTPVTDQQLAEFQRTVNAYYGAFIDAVARGRGMDRDKVEQLADGRVHIGQAAVKLGLADQVATLDQALSDLRQRASARGQTSQKGTRMSESTKTAADNGPQPATLADLKAACEGAPSDFLIAQLEAQATVAQATKSWNAKLRADLAAANEKAVAATKRADEAEAKVKAAPAKPGVTPITGTQGAAESATDAKAEWDEKVSGLMKAGKTRQQAVAHLARTEPQLRERLVAEANPTRNAA